MSEEGNFALADDLHAVRRAADVLFETVGRTLRSILPVSAIVLHVGATAIPGCLTKGDLDVVVRVEPCDFALAERLIAERFSRNEDSVRTSDFASFQDQSSSPHLGIQLTATGGRFDVFHVFAEALSHDGDLLARYNALKRTYDRKPMSEYRLAKDAFIAEVLRPGSCVDGFENGSASS